MSPVVVNTWGSLVDSVISLVSSLESGTGILDGVSATGLTSADLRNIILAIVEHESGGNPAAEGDQNATGGFNSVGLMQINWAAHGSDPNLLMIEQLPGGAIHYVRITSRDELFDPATNLTAGLRIFLGQLKKFEDVSLAILGYNGPADAAHYHADPTWVPPNISYLSDVLDILGETFQSATKQFPSIVPVMGLLLVGTGIVLWKNHRQKVK